MKPIFLIIAMSLTVVLTAEARVSDPGRLRHFVGLFAGLWEAVDPSDGSLTQRSIYCDQDGACHVLGSDSFWVLCGSPRGILRGDGAIEDEGLRVPEFTLTCTEDDRDFVVDTTFVPDPQNGTLLETHVNPNIPTIIFHKKSK